ncbi:MAG: putative MerR-family transcriptional regulator [Anaerolineae bacterium]|jgi:transcriptional regulator with XRE-family HTH domain|nr:MAG: putative MerR-family transcriptional regulator [Anaerolineae bacterium]
MVKSIGERIKSLRNERNMTLAELSQKTNLSSSYLSQLERDKTTPSISSLVEIANALDVNVRYFFEEEQSADLAFVTRKSLAAFQDVDYSTSQELPLTPVNEPSRLRVWQYNLPRATSLTVEALEEGENFCIVLSGEVVLEIGDEKIVLGEGDSAAFAATQSHILTNESSEMSVILYAYAAMRPTHKSQTVSFAIRKEVQ